MPATRTEILPPDLEPSEVAKPRSLKSVQGTGDQIFQGGLRLAGLGLLAILGAVGLLLSIRGISALRVDGPKFLTTQNWQPDTHNFGVATVLTGTVLIAAVAILVAVPLAVGSATFIAEIAPAWMRQTLVSIIDLMAAVPSVVYGLWGAFWLQGHVLGVARWIATWFSWIPIFSVKGADPTNPLGTATVYSASTFIAGLVVGLMIVPIITAIIRQVMSQTPAGEREGAFALGGTRWGMIRSVVFPYARGGIIGAAMLGLGRALGETIAVYLIISPTVKINFHILGKGANSVSSLIALRYGDSSTFGLSALMAAGLALFVLTLVVSFSAASIVSRSRSGADGD
jgi:phosphate transport system permease protein